VPSKSSFNRAHAAKLFESPTLPRGLEDLYIDIDVIFAARIFIDSGISKGDKLEVWQGLDKLLIYFTSLKLSPSS